ncbi:MAG: fluoride efflux transporter CrcB [Bacteroidota bacterium]|jgi:CrcB protein
MIEVKHIAFVVLGSATGGTLRYMMSLYFVAKGLNKFPLATLSINLLGCLFIGIIYAISEKSTIGENIKLLLATGFCGGFTTFSAFAMENLQLIKLGATTTAITYIALSVVLGILLAFLGYILFK